MPCALLAGCHDVETDATNPVQIRVVAEHQLPAQLAIEGRGLAVIDHDAECLSAFSLVQGQGYLSVAPWTNTELEENAARRMKLPGIAEEFGCDVVGIVSSGLDGGGGVVAVAVGFPIVDLLAEGGREDIHPGLEHRQHGSFNSRDQETHMQYTVAVTEACSAARDRTIMLDRVGLVRTRHLRGRMADGGEGQGGEDDV